MRTILVTHALCDINIVVRRRIRDGETYKLPSANMKQSATRFRSVRFRPFNSLIGSNIMTIS